MNVSPFVSVVVVVRNGEKYIKECVESLLNLDYPKESYEIIIVDGMSEDDTKKIVLELAQKNKYPPIRFLSNQKRWISPARNIGIKESKGEYIAFTDADCIVDVNWLKILAEEILKAPLDVVAVGGPNLVYDKDPFIARAVGYMQETFLGSGGAPQSYKIGASKYVYSIPSCNILYRKNLLGDEMYDDEINIGEDCEYTLRLKNKGYKFLYLPKAFVWHHRRGSLGKFAKHMFSYGEAIVQVSKKHKKLVRPFSIIPALTIAAIVLAYPLFLLFPLIIWLYGVASIVYLFALIKSTFYVYQQTKDIRSLSTLILMPIQHFSYGFGFIWGIIK
jgi:cellulose synthase/poly-beta-1,6-N-acetylglucosamine synthase-like glycosyltransferase